MTVATDSFAQLQADLAEGGVEAVLTRLADQLKAQGKLHELFEARKMQIRHQLGLPPLYGDEEDDLKSDQRENLEDGLIDACREVGLLMLHAGQVRDGWMYLRAVGEKKMVADLLDAVEVDDDNVEEIIEVALSEGVAPALGYQLVLDHYGTCNAITTYESQVAQLSNSARQQAAGLLVRHLHNELVATVKADISQQEAAEPPDATLKDLVADRDWLFLDNNYHVDTTHLASTTRFSRILENEEELRLALDLTEYGRHLGSQFQFQENEPFADMYPSHALYFQALLGENVDEAVGYFREKVSSVDPEEHGTIAAEVYIELLARLDRFREGVEASIEMIPEGAQYGIAPSLLELSQRASDFQPYMEVCQQQQNLLGYATGLVYSALDKAAD